jgi:hypothetical protein
MIVGAIVALIILFAMIFHAGAAEPAHGPSAPAALVVQES